MAGNAELRLHALFTEAVIYDIATVRSSFDPLSSDPDVRLLDSLSAAVEAAMAWFELFRKQDIALVLCSSVTMTKHFPRMLFLFDQLTHLEDAAWDTDFVRQKINVQQALEDPEEKLQGLADSIDYAPINPQDESIAMRTLRTIQLKKRWVSCKQKHDVQDESSDTKESAVGDAHMGLQPLAHFGFPGNNVPVYHGIGSLSADPSNVWNVTVGSIL
ncbi:hypothetical protein VTN31DRAFT_2348 [Thermomyces dupontii]|uniref:uncharacterized protein n=1 Tax=Talaromyces thermophilus TaxID=28565 RepID=UPI0037428C15